MLRLKTFRTLAGPDELERNFERWLSGVETGHRVVVLATHFSESGAGERRSWTTAVFYTMTALADVPSTAQGTDRFPQVGLYQTGSSR